MKKHYLLYSFFILITVITFIDIFEKTKKFSELENRMLKTNISFKKEKFLNGNFSKEYEKYIEDQIIFRDEFISLKSLTEKIFFKIENNDILLGRDDFLFDKYFKLDDYRKNYNIKSLINFKQNYAGNVSLMIIPNSYEIYNDKLIGFPKNINQKFEIEKIYSNFKNINCLNILEEFQNHKNEYIYYKTDHHWTIDGAYIAYEKYIKSRNLLPIDIRKNRIEIPNFLGSFYSKAKPIFNKGDVLSYIPIEGLSMHIGDNTFESIYDISILNKRDKYSIYLNGNNPLTIIKNHNLKNNKKILIIKDSFANSFIPYLTSNYEEIHVIDFRTFQDSFKEYLKNKDYNDILILYNFKNFCSESTFMRINK